MEPNLPSTAGPPSSAPPPIPSLQRLGDQIEAAAARSLGAAGSAGADGGSTAPTSILAGGRGAWRRAALPSIGVAAALVVAMVVFVGGGTNTPRAEAALVLAADRTAALTSSRFSLTIEAKGPGSTQRIELSGAYDDAAQKLRAEADLATMLGGLGGGVGGALGDATKIEVIVDNETGYLRSPLLAAVAKSSSPWLRVDARQLGSLFGGSPPAATASSAIGGSVPTRAGRAAGSSGVPNLSSTLPLATDPSALLELLRHAGGEVETLGTERIDGADTTHYRTQLPLASAVAQLEPVDRERVQSLLASLGPAAEGSDAPFDVWVGPTGLVRRVTVSASPIAGSTASITVDYLDPGSPVTIDVPTDATDLDVDSLLGGGLGGLLGGGGSGPAPVSGGNAPPSTER